MPPLALLEQDLTVGKTIVIDGATGTELERRGAEMDDRVWCATASATHPEILRTIHEDYIRAGARIITANTFSTNRNMLAPAGLDDRFEELNRYAVDLALEARERMGAASRVVVAGSMSHQVPILRGSDRRIAREVPPPEVARANFQEMAEMLAASGVDLILVEMMSDPELANPAIAAARATGLPVWVGFAVRASESGALVSHSREDLDVEQMLDAINLDGVRVCGFMHTHVNEIAPALDLLRKRWQGPLMAYPDSGYFVMPHWHFVDIISAGDFVDHSHEWIDAGVQVVGGCCGLGTDHIGALAKSLPSA
jgi:S-methylmethionine-dependent homocysteine/selenocysteine methylase